MDDITKSAFLNRPDLHVQTEGEFQGWRTWSRDSFESHNGPFWHRMEDDGQIRCAFRVENKHLNGMGNVHGGAFMAFADCLFAFAAPVRFADLPARLADLRRALAVHLFRHHPAGEAASAGKPREVATSTGTP